MASLGHQSLPPTNLGREDEEMVFPGPLRILMHGPLRTSYASVSHPSSATLGGIVAAVAEWSRSIFFVERNENVCSLTE
ncbi:hypothetical protein TNCV_4847041 [Trichonephila clavipes]|nr:hypothetical protein TNCV_4847041 [Trichonephila clavipes]